MVAQEETLITENDRVNLLLAFVTGLTTGGLSCLAVQGGLVASSLAHQIEKDVKQMPLRKGSKKRRLAYRPVNRAHLAQPILVFLVAKILAYTALGFLLGLVGQMFQLSSIARAALQIAIGVFMLGNALRMLNVHPIFRYFVFEPPAFLRRRLRHTASGGHGDSLGTPAFLGLLTVLIPCGITQAMLAAALGTADPFQAAALMFAFTLGASPVFFAVAYFATQLGARLEKYFTRFVALVMLVLALFSIDSGLTLAGSPFSLTRWASAAFSPSQAANASTPELKTYDPNLLGSAPTSDSGAGDTASDGAQVTIQVRNTGYQPRTSHAKAGVPIRLHLVSSGVYSCSLAFIIPSLGVQEVLKPTGEAWIDLPAQAPGANLRFSCSMGMFTGNILFDL